MKNGPLDKEVSCVPLVRLGIATAVSGMLLSGCSPARPVTPSPTAVPPTPVRTATASPTPAARRTIEVLPDTMSEVTVLVSDPSMVFSRPEEEPRGPESFWVDGDLVTIADHLNSRIATFQDARIVETLAWPVTKGGEAVPAVDLAIDGDTFYFLAFLEPLVHVHQRVEGRLSPVRVIDFSSRASSQTDQIELQDGNLIGVTYSGTRFLMEGPGELPPDPFLDIDEELPSHLVADGLLNVRLLTSHDPLGIRLLHRDSAGSYYATAESYYDDARGNIVVSHVYQFAADGSLLRTFTPPRDGNHIPNREFRVVDDHLYQLRDHEDGASVLQVHPNPA